VEEILNDAVSEKNGDLVESLLTFSEKSKMRPIDFLAKEGNLLETLKEYYNDGRLTKHEIATVLSEPLDSSKPMWILFNLRGSANQCALRDILGEGKIFTDSKELADFIHDRLEKSKEEELLGKLQEHYNNKNLTKDEFKESVLISASRRDDCNNLINWLKEIGCDGVELLSVIEDNPSVKRGQIDYRIFFNPIRMEIEETLVDWEVIDQKKEERDQ